MIEVREIGSLFYCVITDSDGGYHIVSEGYPTFELCFMMSKMDEILT